MFQVKMFFTRFFLLVCSLKQKEYFISLASFKVTAWCWAPLWAYYISFLPINRNYFPPLLLTFVLASHFETRYEMTEIGC